MFVDRKEAGVKLAHTLGAYKDKDDVVVLALPRGGVVVGYEVAKYLNVAFDVLIVRKIGMPGQSELGIGAVSETGAVYLNEQMIKAYGVPEAYLEEEIESQKMEIVRRVRMYRGGGRLQDLAGKTVIIIDDGVATGATMKATLAALKQEKLAKLVVALPVAPPDTARELVRMVDDFHCLETPSNFMAVGFHYRDFTQVTDQEVVELLQESPRVHH